MSSSTWTDMTNLRVTFQHSVIMLTFQHSVIMLTNRITHCIVSHIPIRPGFCFIIWGWNVILSTIRRRSFRQISSEWVTLIGSNWGWCCSWWLLVRWLEVIGHMMAGLLGAKYLVYMSSNVKGTWIINIHQPTNAFNKVQFLMSIKIPHVSAPGSHC